MTYENKIDDIVIGNSLFPMLYLYYSTIDNSDKIDQNLLTDGMTKYYTEKIKNSPMIIDDIKGKYLEKLKVNKEKYYREMLGAFSKNKTFRWELSNSVAKIMGKFKSRLPKNRGTYYEGANGVGTDWFPILNTSIANT